MEQKFVEWVASLSKKYRQAQIKAAVKINAELIAFYFELGKEISRSSFRIQYGNKFYDNLSKELTSNLNDAKGFSPRNLRYIEKFYTLYKSSIQNLPQLVAQLTSIPWAHHRYIIDKCKDVNKALFYVEKTIENNWSRSVLLNFLDTNLYERQGKGITNFKASLPTVGKDLANEIVKNPYCFNFLALENDFTEKELKDALINNIQKFLTELGTGFALVGKEYRLVTPTNKSFYIDLLMYHVKIHAYVVIEVKIDEVTPADFGQLNFYVNAINDLEKTDVDNDTVGILLCKSVFSATLFAKFVLFLIIFQRKERARKQVFLQKTCISKKKK